RKINNKRRLFIYYRESELHILFVYYIHTQTPFKGFLRNALKMSFGRLLSDHRRLFVRKVYDEIMNNASVNTPDVESEKVYFLQLVEGNKELSEVEKRYCRERFIYCFELTKARNKEGELRECDKCKTTRYSDK